MIIEVGLLFSRIIFIVVPIHSNVDPFTDFFFLLILLITFIFTNH